MEQTHTHTSCMNCMRFHTNSHLYPGFFVFKYQLSNLEYLIKLLIRKQFSVDYHVYDFDKLVFFWFIK